MKEIYDLLNKWRNEAYPYKLALEFGNARMKIITVKLYDLSYMTESEVSDELIEDANCDIISTAIDMCKNELKMKNR